MEILIKGNYLTLFGLGKTQEEVCEPLVAILENRESISG
jgi:hypothetical protein